MNANRLPTTIPEYLEHLRRSLAGADPALIQDALYDAEEYLRSELSEQAGRSEAEVIASVAGPFSATMAAVGAASATGNNRGRLQGRGQALHVGEPLLPDACMVAEIQPAYVGIVREQRSPGCDPRPYQPKLPQHVIRSVQVVVEIQIDLRQVGDEARQRRSHVLQDQVMTPPQSVMHRARNRPAAAYSPRSRPRFPAVPAGPARSNARP